MFRKAHIHFNMRDFLRPTILSSLMLLSASMGAVAQTRTSVANGLFYFPTTWDCMCVPSPHTGESIVINHAVTLNNAIGVYGGSLTVNASGSLTQDATPRDMHVNNNGSVFIQGGLTIDRLWVQSGNFENQGTSTIRTLANEMTLTNSSTINVADSLYNAGTLTNSPSGTINVSTFYNDNVMINGGQVLNVDSMTNAGTMTNSAFAVIEVDSATNTGGFQNDGSFSVIALTTTGSWTNVGTLDFSDMLNFGSFMNNGILQGAGSLGNLGDFSNNTSGTIDLGVSFFNTDQIPPQPGGMTAMFSNTGTVTVGDSWYNFAIVQGVAPGSFTVQDSTVNYGTLIGTFDLCDLTPTTVTPPIIDFNFGTVDAGITYCGIIIGVDDQEPEGMTVFPNPTEGIVNLRFTGPTDAVLTLTDMTGRDVLTSAVRGQSTFSLDLGHLPSGMYVLRTTTADAVMIQRIILR